MADQTESGNTRIAFLALSETLTHDGYLGAVLVTSLQGVPQEFRCTHPVKPTAIQKPLYGDTLEPYIGVDLCGIPLLESLQNKPSLVLVGKEFLLSVRKACTCPLVLIRRAGEPIDITATDEPASSNQRARIDSPSGRFQPIILVAHPNHQADLDFVRSVIEKASAFLDPLEPFERIQRAIEVLAKQDKKFQ